MNAIVSKSIYISSRCVVWLSSIFKNHYKHPPEPYENTKEKNFLYTDRKNGNDHVPATPPPTPLVTRAKCK